MNKKLEDEDYWNSSDTTGFSFDDEEMSSASSLFESSKFLGQSRQPKDASTTNQNNIFGEFSLSLPLSTSKSIEMLLPKRSILAILDEPAPRKENVDPKLEFAEIKKQIESPTVASTVRSIVLGKPYSLHFYRSLDSKTKLLEEAVKSGDGNAILCVLLFLKNTLKKKLFCQLLQFHPSAVPVYVNYLTTRFEIRSAVDVLVILGRLRQAALKDFQFLIQPQQSIEKRLHNLKVLRRDHFSQPNAEDKEFIDNFLKYVEWLAEANKRGCTVNGTVFESLDRLCSDHWHEAKEGILSPMNLTISLNVTDRLFHWVAIKSRATVKSWEDLEKLLLTKGWLGAKKLKSVIAPERIVMELHRQEAPEKSINEYFLLIDNIEKRLDLARKLCWHSAVIDTYIHMRDRQGLMQYQAALNPQTRDYLHAEIALRNNANKWKN